MQVLLSPLPMGGYERHRHRLPLVVVSKCPVLVRQLQLAAVLWQRFHFFLNGSQRCGRQESGQVLALYGAVPLLERDHGGRLFPLQLSTLVNDVCLSGYRRLDECRCGSVREDVSLPGVGPVGSRALVRLSLQAPTRQRSPEIGCLRLAVLGYIVQ